MIDFAHIDTYRENNRIEAKTALGGFPQSLWETYSAFANTLGGIILLGVVENKDKTFHTVNLPDPEAHIRTLWEGLNNPAKVSRNILNPQDAFVETIDGNRIVVICVPKADRLSRPIYIENNPSMIYKRNGEGDYKCSPAEYAWMMRDAALETQDTRLLDNASVDDLARESLQSFRQRISAFSPTGNSAGSDYDFYRELGALAADSKGLLHPTAAGLLMFGKAESIRRYFPTYRLSFSVNGEIQVSSAEHHFGNLCDFFFRACALLRQAFPHRHKEEDSLFFALREALLNALINADYEAGGEISVQLLGDRVIISNPGGFRMEKSSVMIGGHSDPRNCLLQRFFSAAGIGSRLGSGVPGIYRSWQKAGLPAPTFDESTNPDRVELTLPLSSDISSGGAAVPGAEAENMILDYLTDHPSSTLPELAEYLHLKFSQVQDFLDTLDSRHLLAQDIGTEGPVYRLKA